MRSSCTMGLKSCLVERKEKNWRDRKIRLIEKKNDFYVYCLVYRKEPKWWMKL